MQFLSVFYKLILKYNKFLSGAFQMYPTSQLCKVLITMYIVYMVKLRDNEVWCSLQGTLLIGR